MNQTKINVKFFIILAFLILVYFVTMYGQIQRVQEINSSKPTIESSTSVYERYDNRIELLGIKIKDHLVLCQILIAIFLAIAFLQSGLDKIIDRLGKLEYFDEHFAKSSLRSVTSPALSVLTVMEICGGLLCVFGVFYTLKEKSTIYIFYGLLIIAFTILMLFFGQRVNKDYIGAANLVPYFILTMIAIMSMYLNRRVTMSKALSLDIIKSFRKNIIQDSSLRLAQNAAVRNEIIDLAMDWEYFRKIDHTFSDLISGEMKATDQKSSGRCWGFAGLNLFRIYLGRKHGIKDFEFSQSYFMFWDK